MWTHSLEVIGFVSMMKGATPGRRQGTSRQARKRTDGQDLLVAEGVDKDMRKWDEGAVQAWLNNVGLAKHSASFAAAGIKGSCLMQMTDTRLIALKLLKGERTKLMRLIQAAVQPLLYSHHEDDIKSAPTRKPKRNSLPGRQLFCRYRDPAISDRSLQPYDIKVTRQDVLQQRKGLVSYGLKKKEISPNLQAELDQFHKFMVNKYFGQQEPRIRPPTATAYLEIVIRYLGYQRNIEGVPLEKLSLEGIFPDSSKQSVSPVFEYLQWLVSERKIHPNTEIFVIRTFIQLAKFRFRNVSTADPTYGDKSYQDIIVVRELRKLTNDATARAKTAVPTCGDETKRMTWPEYLETVEKLRCRCVEAVKRGNDKQTALAFQAYLLSAILACVPDRQRTLRELQVNRTLFKQPDETWMIKHTAEDYKTGSTYGDRPPMPISAHISPYLEEWLHKWRAVFKPNHDFLFTDSKGRPLDSHSLYDCFRGHFFGACGRPVNPHYVRDLIVTHLRGTDASEKQLEALAIFMGHSLAMQKSTYDRRTKSEKVAPAVEVLAGLYDASVKTS